MCLNDKDRLRYWDFCQSSYVITSKNKTGCDWFNVFYQTKHLCIISDFQERYSHWQNKCLEFAIQVDYSSLLIVWLLNFCLYIRKITKYLNPYFNVCIISNNWIFTRLLKLSPLYPHISLFNNCMWFCAVHNGNCNRREALFIKVSWQWI